VPCHDVILRGGLPHEGQEFAEQAALYILRRRLTSRRDHKSISQFSSRAETSANQARPEHDFNRLTHATNGTVLRQQQELRPTTLFRLAIFFA